MIVSLAKEYESAIKEKIKQKMYEKETTLAYGRERDAEAKSEEAKMSEFSSYK